MASNTKEDKTILTMSDVLNGNKKERKQNSIYDPEEKRMTKEEEVEYRKQESKRNEAILGVTLSTPEDIKKASEKLIKQLDKIINND